MSPFTPGNVFLLFLLLLQRRLPPTAGGASTQSRTLASFSAHGRVNQFLKVPKASGDGGEWLILGTVNRLYVLELANLTLAHEAVTGPVLDSPFCNAELSSCVGPRDGIVETDTWNKILLPLNSSLGGAMSVDAVLVCGSTRQGECQLRQLPSLERLHRHAAVAGAWQHVPVAANAPDASTAALLVASRLFVGAQSAHADSPYREALPAVTTRLLTDGLQPVRAGSLDGEAAVYIRTEFRARLPVRYLLAFNDSQFAYWLVVQPASAQSGAPLTTRLVRVCLEDDRYTSYSELELQCRSAEDNALFGIARAGAVLEGAGNAASGDRQKGGILYAAFSDVGGTRSALCAFPLPKLRLTFWYNIDRCRTGTDTFGMPHIGRDAKCTNRSHLPLPEDTCLLGVGGPLEAAAPALGVFRSGTAVTAIGTARVDGHALVTVGTARGELIQMEVPSGDQTGSVRIYAEFRAAADPIERIGILKDGMGMLITAEREVLLVSLSQCGTSSTSASCNDCLAGGDPLCTWCLSLGRCTRPRHCPTPEAVLRKCPSAYGSPRPENVSLNALSRPRVLLSVRGLPRLGVDLAVECAFGAAFAFRTRAQPHADGFLCPLASEMPRLAPGHDHLEVPVALRVVGTRANLVEPPATITLYSCATHQLCSTCSASKWPCRWCASERKCVDAEDTKKKCRAERLRSSSSACIRILPALPGSELLVPDSTNTSLELHVDNMPSGELPLACRLMPNSNDVPRVARIVQRDTVRCESGMFKFEESEAVKNVTLELLAEGEPVDATTVTIFKCSLMASDCSRCVALDARFACTWCDGGCRHSTKCLLGHDAGGAAMAADELCTAPAIREFSPLSGPLEGGTVVDIRGRDLGSRLKDVQDRVQVAGVPCRVLHYEVSERIVCITDRSPLPFRAPVRLTIGRSARRNAESTAHFEFRSPQVQSAQPAFGPQSGGTRLQLIGTGMEVGRNASVHLDNLECAIQERESDRIVCLTAASPRAYTVTAIRLQIDGAVRLLPAKFQYRTDPEVRDVQPRTAYESGGRKLTVTGSHLDSVLSPKLFLLSSPTVASAAPDEMELVSELGACFPLNVSALSCESPSLALPTALLRQSSMARWMVGMAMDGVRTVRNLGPGIQLTTVPDPQFSPFAGLHVLQPEQPLMLSGQWLSQAALPAEYSVTIGTVPCPVFLLEPDRLLCRPPTLAPAPTDDAGTEMRDGRPLVVVRVGRVRAEIGPLEYAGGGGGVGGISRLELLTRRAGVLGLAVVLAAVCAVLAAVGLAWRRRQGEHERTYRRIQLQMEQMESQAFAELQTDVLAELDGVDDGAGIPFLESREFMARLLLRDLADPTMTGGFGGALYSSQLPMTLAQFESLLWNRQFIYVLVQMAEEEPTVSASERSSLAALLLAVLSRNMAFATDVVLSLLSAHVQRCALMHAPHLLFRHSDSLVEKLFQHWLTLCLLPHLHDVDGSARPLFLLYRALKSLTEKGPVDAVTGQARYSLSEQALLRESFETRALTVLVIPLDGFDQAPVPVRALDCDTISQLKAKLLDILYRNVPYSTHIGTDQFDLEWRCPRRGSVLLLDDDQSQRRGRRRRLNTLAHYAVPDQALLAMQARAGAVPHAHATCTFRSGGSSNSDQSGFGWRSMSANQLLSSSSDSSGSSPNSGSGTDPAAYYHLQQPPGTAGGGGGTQKSARSSRDRRSGTMLSEVFLTRLLMCKGTLQRFVDSFFESVLFTDQQQQQQHNIPIVLKYVFDFLDAEASHCPQPIESDVVHAWKANCWVLRFWQQFLHCPDLLFDVPPRPASLAGSLAVLGQTLVEAFSRADLELSSASPSSRLLFARDIARFRPRVDELFRWIASQPPISTQHFFDYIATLSNANGLRLVEALEGDPDARRARLADRLRQIVQSTLLQDGGRADEHVYATLR
uniref:Sema domain-containing protein n=1 Tax=Globodera pallida TaxID=36090 RepID=A0A183BYN8_GLOPA